MFIVVEMFGMPEHGPHVIVDENTGSAKVFTSYEKAKKFAERTCQDPAVLFLGQPALRVVRKGSESVEYYANAPIRIAEVDQVGFYEKKLMSQCFPETVKKNRKRH